MLGKVYISIFLTYLLALSAFGADVLSNNKFQVQLRVLNGSQKDLSEEESSKLSYPGIFDALQISPEDYFAIFSGKPITDQKSFDNHFNPSCYEKIYVVPYKKIEVFDLNNPKDSYALKCTTPNLAPLRDSLRRLNLGLNTDDCPLSYGGELLINDNQLRAAFTNPENRIYIDFSSSLQALEREGRQSALDLAKENLKSTRWEGVFSNKGGQQKFEPPTLFEMCPLAPKKFWDYLLTSNEKTAKDEIFPNFFIGDVLSTFMALYGPEAGQFTIFNFYHLDGLLEPAEHQAKAKGFNYHQIRILDTEEAFQDLLQAFKENDLQLKITEALLSGKKVLLACQMGVSRSVTIAILYLMYEFNLNAIQAYRAIKNSRPNVEPNLGFLVGLLAIEKEQAEINPYIPQEIGEAWLSSLAETTKGKKK